MTNAGFKYDVAFSFTMADEPLAQALHDLLSARMGSFIYSERQREIAGTDGQKTFSDVYGKWARVVVILFRSEWGQTPWTRVEEQAIRQRAFDQGFDFTIFIPTIERPQLPGWFPKTRLYVGLERWGVSGAAAAIEARVTELGGVPSEEDVPQRAARFARAKELSEKQKQFHDSGVGVKAALAAYDEFSKCLGALAHEIREIASGISYRREQRYGILTGLFPLNAIANFNLRFSNTLENAVFELAIFKGFPNISGYHGSIERATKVWTEQFSYRLVRDDHHCWVGGSPQFREFTSDKLAQYFLRKYLDASEKAGFDRG